MAGLRSRTGILAAVLVSLGLLAPAADAQSPEAMKARAVRLKVLVVYASPKEGKIDPACTELHQRLLRANMNLKSLRVVGERRFKLDFGHQEQMLLPSGRQLRFLPITIVKNELHMQFEVPDVINTRLRLASGRPVILGGHRHGEGQLIVQVVPKFHIVKATHKPRAPAPANP